MLANNANSKKFASQYKKTLSSLAQASLMSQARYYIDYSNLSEDSSDESCRSDALSSGNNSMCGLFNNVFSAKSYKGTYGNVSGILPLSKYSIQTTSQGFNPDGFMIYSLSDGAIVGFNPNAKGCSLEEGTRVNNEAITGSLANCVGFIDVNGVSLPNREVTCDTSSETSLSPNTACSVQKANGDVFPVVFHNGTVEPATNAARAILNAARSSAGETSGRKKITYNGHEYEYYSDYNEVYAPYFYEDENGNLVGTNGKVYTKRDDGKYEYVDKGPNIYLFDSDMKEIARTFYSSDEWWYRTDNDYYRQDENGNLLLYSTRYNTPYYTKRDDGKYEWTDNKGNTYLVGSDFNKLGFTDSNGQWWDYNIGSYSGYVRPLDNGNYEDSSGNIYTKRDDGKYERTTDYGYTYLYDSDMQQLGAVVDGQLYTQKTYISGGVSYYRKDENGNIVSTGGTVYTKRDDGLYERDNGDVYDENFNRL